MSIYPKLPQQKTKEPAAAPGHGGAGVPRAAPVVATTPPPAARATLPVRGGFLTCEFYNLVMLCRTATTQSLSVEFEVFPDASALPAPLQCMRPFCANRQPASRNDDQQHARQASSLERHARLGTAGPHAECREQHERGERHR